jgi:fatty acid desaturase
MAHSIKSQAGAARRTERRSSTIEPMTDTLERAPAPDHDRLPDPAGLTDGERARRIRVAIRARSAELHERHPWLRHQSAIGAGILALSALGVIGTAVAYGAGALAWWFAVPLAAIFMSLAHEIEHDTIHRLYFARNRRAQDVMFAVCWLLRPYTISPWSRRPLHLLHHKVSGTEHDIEEQAITNGQTWSAARALMMIDPVASTFLRLPDDPGLRKRYLGYVAKAYFPLTYVALAVWYAFLLSAAVALATGGSLPATGPLAVVGFLTVVWIAPNVLRVACLHFVSSNMHYYGDVEEGNVVQQTQVLNRWYLAPLNLFCVNFGSTHGIHHFVPGHPFYIRQATTAPAHEAMRVNGVRFNDLGTFRRANRYGRG